MTALYTLANIPASDLLRSRIRRNRHVSRAGRHGKPLAARESRSDWIESLLKQELLLDVKTMSMLCAAVHVLHVVNLAPGVPLFVSENTSVLFNFRSRIVCYVRVILFSYVS